MKEKLLKALFASIVVTLGITLGNIVQNESFSLMRLGLCAIVTFIVDFGFTCIFDKKKE